jgi:hypothetical protein
LGESLNEGLLAKYDMALKILDRKPKAVQAELYSYALKSLINAIGDATAIRTDLKYFAQEFLASVKQGASPEELSGIELEEGIIGEDKDSQIKSIDKQLSDIKKEMDAIHARMDKHRKNDEPEKAKELEHETSKLISKKHKLKEKKRKLSESENPLSGDCKCSGENCDCKPVSEETKDAKYYVGAIERLALKHDYEPQALYSAFKTYEKEVKNYKGDDFNSDTGFAKKLEVCLNRMQNAVKDEKKVSESRKPLAQQVLEAHSKN